VTSFLIALTVRLVLQEKLDARLLTTPLTFIDDSGFKWIRGALLNRGAHSKVYLAMDAGTAMLMAAKQVDIPEHVEASDQDARQTDITRNAIQALKRQSNFMRDLVHENIVGYIGFEEKSDYMAL
jgi:mitogen-activated protein kinase kinase kinase ANP1